MKNISSKNYDSFLGKIINALINKPLLVNLVIIFIVIAAIISIYQIQKVGLPRVDTYEVVILTTYPGASPEDVELNVTRKIEEALEEVSDIEESNSQSMENLSIINVKIDSNTEDLDEVKDEIQRSIVNIHDFPEEVKDRPLIEEQISDNWPVYYIGLYQNEKNKIAIQETAIQLRKDLMKLGTVAKVNKVGIPDREIHIKLNRYLLEKYDTSFEEVVSAIQSNKIRLSAGSIESYTTERGIVTFSEFSTPKEIGNIIIKSNDMGYLVRLKQVASIEWALEKMDTKHRINGKEGMILAVVKQGKADIIESVDEIKSVLEHYKNQKHLPQNLKIITLHDQSIETRVRLQILYSNAIAGFILVLTILFIFFSRRIAIWTSAGIPVAIGIAFIIISFTDATMNRISLMGLIVVLGMLVDDAIIIAENIFRYEEKGEKPSKAAIIGVLTVVNPVIATVLTTVIAFLPMYFIPGMEMDFAREVPTFVIAMLAGSLIESVFILPAHLGHTRKKQKPKAAPGEFFLRKMENAYEKLLQIAFRHRYKSIFIMTTFLIMSFVISSFITNFKLFPIDQANHMVIWGELKEGSSLGYTSEKVKEIEKIIEKLPNGVIVSYQTTLGKKGINNDEILSNIFKIRLNLTPSTQRDMTALDVKNKIFSELNKTKNPFEKLDYYIDGGGPPVGKPVEIQVIGNDTEKRLKAIKDIEVSLKKHGVKEIDNDYRDGKPELRLKPHYENISMARTSVSSVASVIRTAFDGYEAAYLDTPREQIPFRVLMDKNFINVKNPLEGLYVRNQLGMRVPVQQLVHAVETRSPQTIYHYNGIRSNRISGNIEEGKSANTIYNELKKEYKNFSKKYPTLEINLGGEAERSSDMIGQMIIATSLAILAIYFLLVIQFNSFLQPGIVIMAIPFGLAGILLAFGLQRMDIALMSLTGIMGYAGVVVNDSLIMVDFINQLKKESIQNKSIEREKLNKSIIEGAKLRLRPIFLTTVTTVAGLIPTAYGFFGGHDSFVSPLVMAMAWGLIIGTPSVLFVIPVFYSVLEDILYWKSILTEKILVKKSKEYFF